MERYRSYTGSTWFDGQFVMADPAIAALASPIVSGADTVAH